MEIGKQIKVLNDKESFFVFNPLNWERNDYADLPYHGGPGITVYDVSEKKEVLWQLVKKKGQPCLRILATGIPETGYKVFEIIKRTSSAQNNSAALAGNSFENSRYKISLTREGVITSIIDKLNDRRELVKASPGGRYFNDMGSGASDTGDSLIIENEGPVSVTVKAHGINKLKHTSSITLFDSVIPRIDIQNNIEQNFSSLVSNTFSFNFNRPSTWHEEIGAVIKAGLTVNGGHYAAKNARYDWLTLNHFASMGMQSFNVTLANRDCYFFKPGKSTHDTLDEDASYINVLVGGQTDGANLGIPGQGGDSAFEQQFSVSVHNNPFNKIESMKSSMEFQQPLIAGMVKGEKDAPLPFNSYALIKTSGPGLILWALKPAEEGVKMNGIIVRVWNLNGSVTRSDLKFNRNVSSATETTHVEVDMKPIPFKKNVVSIEAESQQMKTFRIKFK
jgi:alpha-mannosidase